MKIFKFLLWAMVGMFCLGFWAGQAQARVQGVCSDCHTMHNSQNGTAVFSGGPYRALTKGDCLGCHTGTNTNPGTASQPIPYVFSETTEPNYTFGDPTNRNILAGGNFYWVQTNDAAGHNVPGVASQDGALGGTPPGFIANYGSKGRSSWNATQVTCAGTDGCHGDPSAGDDDFAAISGAHHADDSTIDGTTVGTSFRFLLGIKGTEDNDWEFTASTSDHNGYYAVDRSTVNDNSTAPDEASINYLCGQCHGDFHANVDYDSTVGSPWIRHPTDYDMNNVSSKEYGQYPNTTLFTNFGITAAGDYFPDVPVGNANGTVLSKVLQGADDAIVLCISCHKAHGSPYDDILRWDYSTCAVGGSSANATCGCFACHTSK